MCLLCIQSYYTAKAYVSLTLYLSLSLTLPIFLLPSLPPFSLLSPSPPLHLFSPSSHSLSLPPLPPLFSFPLPPPPPLPLFPSPSVQGYYRRASANMALGKFKLALKDYEAVS